MEDVKQWLRTDSPFRSYLSHKGDNNVALFHKVNLRHRNNAILISMYPIYINGTSDSLFLPGTC